MESKYTEVDRSYFQFKEIEEYLIGKGELTFKVRLEESFNRSLIISAASYFEVQIINHLIEFCGEFSDKLEIVEFLKNKAISRQYHTYFSWKENNANNFLGLFGSEFKDYALSVIKGNEKFTQSIKDFIDLNRERNKLAHENFVSFVSTKSTNEIYTAYTSALYFVDNIPNLLRRIELERAE
jgi:hypothetical protein